MDFSFSQLQDLKLDNVTNLTHLPSTILDTLVPGYSFVSQLIFKVSGIDIGILVSGGLILGAIYKLLQYFWWKGYDIFSDYFHSSVQIENNDKLFKQVMKWIAEQRMAKEARHVKAVTKNFSRDSDSKLAQYVDCADGKGIFNFSKWASSIPPRYEPNYGSHQFWHEGRLFFFQRAKKDGSQKIVYYHTPEDEYLTISCIGRSTQPIKDWLNTVKKWSQKKDTDYTYIYRPEGREGGGSTDWDEPIKRPSRPMNTVSLDKEQKEKIVVDINEYLNPATGRWYAARGIPYRRGYLFHGPPGTGKTSLSFALAGIFGLDIYCVSLMEPKMTESDLLKMFNNLPRRCVVLLEDIDSAGLRRRDNSSSKDEPSGPNDNDSAIDCSSAASVVDAGSLKGEDSIKVSDLAKALTTAQPKSNISLSGLLNAIDGVATHEGRVLIMTTNHAEHLDSALLRPGRVDMQIRFTLATKQQARDIFIRMYSDDRTKKTDTDDYDSELDVPENVRELAEQFAERIPECRLSPAEVQGFLLTRKKEPERAVEEVEEWRERILAAKTRGENVIDGM
ncbi:P-loop containing nucleoside triphosphate hydrolase protein [Delitschia confertaspora ATCC 74209]|uniref:P-loop containing nucleoside triphosphate hydrolase protein n=1 Tax=Delitschia confertaspora ATCC 74209 TaxID=1513339 RepID=A0A9P4MWC6_9PLEO|nr:P-loop containing nucleoside triphosphate hydrolase protein [Delitschia confertaspora ATCC 74209]